MIHYCLFCARKCNTVETVFATITDKKYTCDYCCAQFTDLVIVISNITSKRFYHIHFFLCKEPKAFVQIVNSENNTTMINMINVPFELIKYRLDDIKNKVDKILLFR